MKVELANDAGFTVYAGTDAYHVIRVGDEYYIKCPMTNYVIGLTHQDRETLNDSKFYFYL